MANKMKKLVLLLIPLVAVLFTVGYIGDSMNSQESSGKSAVVEVTQLEQINTSLQENPVFLKIGAKWCPHCQSMQPIVEKMAAEYTGNATMATIDVDQSPELAKYFGVEFIPDSCVIVGIENGTYVYMQENGTVSTDRSQARFVGINETFGPNEENFTRVLDLAVLQRGESQMNESQPKETQTKETQTKETQTKGTCY